MEADVAVYELIAPVDSFDRWPHGMRAEMEANRDSPIVGSTLVSETDKVRVWHLLVPAGKRCSFHCHVLDYFWTCHTHGRARGYYEDGSITETVHFPGDTMHNSYRAGERLVHSVENVGSTDLLFTTVEYLQSANAPLPVPDSVRLKMSA
jgi:beta-alanine degradation protein BauB